VFCSFRLLPVALTAAAVLLTASPAPAVADPPTATLSAIPNPAPQGADVEFGGGGYDPGDWVEVYCGKPSGAAVTSAGPVDAGGRIDVWMRGATDESGVWACTARHQVQTGQTVRYRTLTVLDPPLVVL
jgi:hypothetical protein